MKKSIARALRRAANRLDGGPQYKVVMSSQGDFDEFRAEMQRAKRHAAMYAVGLGR